MRLSLPPMPRLPRGPLLAAAAIAALSSCAPMPQGAGRAGAGPDVASRALRLPNDLPPMKAFASARVAPPARPNSQLAQDFLDLSFALESGRALPVLSRFEGPVTLAVTGRAPRQLEADLGRLLQRLRMEAGIDIRRISPTDLPAGSNASITLEVVPRARLKALVPQAACFVAPNVSSLAEYRRARGTAATDWTRLVTRKRMAVFVPGDVSPQEMRDCLHEEIAQALGPVNDLYRLDDSVFNDDNFHTVLTGFDMLMLRAYYAPELRSGMTRGEVARALPAILARLNPAGGPGVARPYTTERADWKQAIETALGGRAATPTRRAAARRAVAIARAEAWRDTRLAFSLFAWGRLNLGHDSAAALAAFAEAQALYRANPRTGLQAANMAVQLAAYELSAGRPARALTIVEANIAPVHNAENAALLATLLMIKAEALSMLGERTQAELVRLDSLGWARYGFGSNEDVAARLTEIAAIARHARG